jgi:hypothetical protein
MVRTQENTSPNVQTTVAGTWVCLYFPALDEASTNAQTYHSVPLERIYPRSKVPEKAYPLRGQYPGFRF